MFHFPTKDNSSSEFKHLDQQLYVIVILNVRMLEKGHEWYNIIATKTGYHKARII